MHFKFILRLAQESSIHLLPTILHFGFRVGVYIIAASH